MIKKFKDSNNVGTFIGVGTAIGVAVFAITNEPTWIAVGVAIGVATVSYTHLPLPTKRIV